MNVTEVVKAAGIVGAGGAGFPTHVKLNAKADWFIVNAAECEPLIETEKNRGSRRGLRGPCGRVPYGHRAEGEV